MVDPDTGQRPDAGQRPARRRADRDRVTVRRALIAGGVVWALVGGPLVMWFAPAGGQASAVGMLLGLVFAGMITSTWLLVAAAIDLWTGQPVDRRRLAWTVGVTIATMLSPLLVLGAGG